MCSELGVQAMLRTTIFAVIALFLLRNDARAQVPPDSLVRLESRTGITIWEVLPDRLLSRRRLYLPQTPADLRSFMVILCDPRTGELWSPQESGSYPASIARIELVGSQFRVAEEIPLPFTLTQVAGAGFDDDGHLVVCGTGGMVYTIDLERRQILRQVCLCVRSVSYFAPSRRGRPALAELSVYVTGSTWYRVVASLDESGNVSREYWRSAVGNPNVTTQGIVTTNTGRSFVAGTPLLDLAGFWEVEYTLGRLVSRQHLSPYGGLAGVMEDPSREVLHLWHPGPYPHAPFTRGVFDLRTNRVVQQLHDLEAPNLTIFQQSHAGWYPRDRLLASPLQPQTGTNFDAVLSVGGDPGEAALLWFDRAELGGVPIGGIGTIVSAGLVDANGLFRTRLPYQPRLLPLRAGDALFFEGFTWDGNALVRTGEVPLRWR